MNSINEKIAKQELFAERLQLIQKKNENFFLKRKAKNYPDEQDRLGCYYYYSYNETTIWFGMADKTDLPQSIMDECNKAFEEIFLNSNSNQIVN
ncbi:MAG TPA: hypothetical protein PLN13_03345 [Bacteroidia bacterium]|nr:hypothetical protein [Bacteroidia bacterium]HRH07589.1 hypothetical protein [Bacteroidia bacterium]